MTTIDASTSIPMVDVVMSDGSHLRTVVARLIGKPVMIGGKAVAVEIELPDARINVVEIKKVKAVNEAAKALLAVPGGKA